MARLKEEDYNLILSYLDAIINGNVYTPFSAKNNDSPALKKIIASLEELRKEVIYSRSESLENYCNVQQEIANVTHDLKTPLAIILGSVECLEDGINDRDYLKSIKEKALEMNNTVLRIISSSKDNVESIKKEKRVVNSRSLFTPFLENYRPLVEGKGIKFSLNKVPEVELAVAEAQVLSALGNVVTNAIKYTEKGKISIRSKRTNTKFFIIVKDTGIGISKDDLPRLFDRFYSSDLSRKTGGSGIGLNYAKLVFEEHGGSISAISKLGKGSTFTISLPRAEKKKKKALSKNASLCLELGLRIFLFPFFWFYDLFRFFYYACKPKDN